MSLAWGRIGGYRNFGQSVAGYLLQFQAPNAALVRADGAAVAVCVSAPMHAMSPGLMPLLPAFGGSLQLPEIQTIGRAAVLRCALRHPHIGAHIDRLQPVAGFDTSLLAPRQREWQRRNSLAYLAMALAQGNGLPARVREADRLQRAIQAHLERTSAADDVMADDSSPGVLSLWMRCRRRRLPSALLGFPEFGRCGSYMPPALMRLAGCTPEEVRFTLCIRARGGATGRPLSTRLLAWCARRCALQLRVPPRRGVFSWATSAYYVICLFRRDIFCVYCICIYFVQSRATFLRTRGATSEGQHDYPH